MVRLCLTFDAKVLSTCIAPNSMLGHVLSSLSADRLPLIVFLALDDLSFLHHHHITTRAADQIRILFDDLHQLTFLYLFLIFF